MQFKKKLDSALTHITLRVPLKEWNQLKIISKQNNWVVSDVARQSFLTGISKFLKEYENESKPVQTEMF